MARVAVALATVLSAAACGGESTSPGGDNGVVVVFAAASLADAMTELEAAFESQHDDIDVQLNLAGSAALREQILDGAPADVFASANEATMEVIVEAGLTDGEPLIFAENAMVLAVPSGNPGSVTGLADLARDELLVGLCAEGVPCGDFARQVLAAADIEPAVDTEESDVRSLVTKLAAGELDAGIVYRTDVWAEVDRIEGIEIPDEFDVVARYPIAALVEAPDPVGAGLFVEFVSSDRGRQILADAGFSLPPGGS